MELGASFTTSDWSQIGDKKIPVSCLLWLLKPDMTIPLFNFLAADDVFVRKDLLKTKYSFVDFAAAEEFQTWCSHYSQCNLYALRSGMWRQ